MDINELMELDEPSFMSYIVDHIRKNGRTGIINAVAIDSNDSSHDTDSHERTDESSAESDSDE